MQAMLENSTESDSDSSFMIGCGQPKRQRLTSDPMILTPTESVALDEVIFVGNTQGTSGLHTRPTPSAPPVAANSGQSGVSEESRGSSRVGSRAPAAAAPAAASAIPGLVYTNVAAFSSKPLPSRLFRTEHDHFLQASCPTS